MKSTPQSKLVFETIQKLGHATNQQILNVVHHDMPDLSVTTVHRITKRLVDNGQAQHAQTAAGVTIVDARVDKHSHFNCLSCGGIVDLDLPEYLVEQVQEQLGDHVAGGLTISGSCAACVISVPDSLKQNKVNEKELIS